MSSYQNLRSRNTKNLRNPQISKVLFVLITITISLLFLVYRQQTSFSYSYMKQHHSGICLQVPLLCLYTLSLHRDLIVNNL